MTELEAINDLEDKNEKCYLEREGCCSDVINNVCCCRDGLIVKALKRLSVDKLKQIFSE